MKEDEIDRAGPTPLDDQVPTSETGAQPLLGAKQTAQAVGGWIKGLFSKSEKGDDKGQKSGADKGQKSGADKGHTPDQKAAVELAKEAKANGGLAESEAKALVELAAGTGLKARGPEAHTKGAPTSREPHIHVEKQNHIPVKPD